MVCAAASYCKGGLYMGRLYMACSIYSRIAYRGIVSLRAKVAARPNMVSA